MKRLAKITLMLAVYLVWVFGNSVTALSCHVNHAEHIHCCGQSCDCHHEGCEKIHFESPHGCHHDHSNRIALYDISKENEIDIEPIALTSHIALNSYLLSPISYLITTHYYEQSERIPPSPTLLGHGLRAPPVVA